MLALIKSRGARRKLIFRGGVLLLDSCITIQSVSIIFITKMFHVKQFWKPLRVVHFYNLVRFYAIRRLDLDGFTLLATNKGSC